MLEGLENDFETTQKKIIIRLCHRFGIRKPGVEQIYRHFDLDMNDLRNELTAREYSKIQGNSTKVIKNYMRQTSRSNCFKSKANGYTANGSSSSNEASRRY